MIMHQIIKKAFTLIELLVVIAIIGILSGLIVVSMSGVTEKATIAKAQVFSNSLRNSLMLNLVSEWNFDGLASAYIGQTIYDSWSGGNNGTLTSTTADVNNKLSTDCISGKCLYFDGDDYVIMPSTASLNNLTGAISIWVKISQQVNATYTCYTFISTVPNAQNLGWKFEYMYNSGNMLISLRKWATEVGASRTFTIPVNKWTHLVTSWNGTYNTFYFNGVAATPNSLVSPTAGAHTPMIGADSRGVSSEQYFRGYMDDLRVFNAPISSSKAKEIYFAGLSSLLINSNIDIKEYREKINSIATNE
jgi:prepilin-type N-terminal cleavage/methylation domain-containing protein